MGLLDDAIREHLELKRLRGTDPGEVARKEREALGSSEHLQADTAGSSDEDELPIADPTQETPAGDKHSDRSALGEQTVELEMESALGSQTGSSSFPTETPNVGSSVGGSSKVDVREDSLEWEMPVDHQQHESSASQHRTNDRDDEPVEDVLEETPEFLRDTPEQERLWFEQRPPRDFDFNE
jgi:hypothetical protein